MEGWNYWISHDGACWSCFGEGRECDSHLKDIQLSLPGFFPKFNRAELLGVKHMEPPEPVGWGLWILHEAEAPERFIGKGDKWPQKPPN